MRKYLLSALLSTTLILQLNAQSISINTTSTAPDPSSMLDIVSSNKGLLIPRLALTALNSTSPVGSSIATSLLVYNTATAGTAPNNVVPGFYYWDGTKWVALSGSGGKDWGVTGNAGTNPTTNFIGTTDAQPLLFRVNNLKAGQIDHDIFSANTSLGTQALSTNASSNNTAFGFRALGNNTYSAGNIAIGNNALFTQSYTNSSSLWYTNNIAIGYNALNFNQPTSSNNAVQNIAIGNYAMELNTTGFFNTIIGYEAMRANTTGGRNVAIGDRALRSQSFSNNNLTYTTDNVAVGYEALYFTQPTSTTNGYGNTGVGFYALRSNYAGYNNTAIGSYADVSSANTLNNATAIGYNAKATMSNSMILGGTGADAVSVGIGTSAPVQTLDVSGRMHLLNGVIQRGGTAITTTSDLGLYSRVAGNWMRFVTNGAPIRFFSDDAQGTVANMTIESNGNVGIGTTDLATGYKLSIDGKIICEEARVQNSTAWPDYVFKNDYNLLPLEELEQIIQREKHLPGVPSASVVEKEGFDLGNMNAKLLEKVEELTLYLIDLKKENTDLKKRIQEVEQVIKK